MVRPSGPGVNFAHGPHRPEVRRRWHSRLSGNVERQDAGHPNGFKDATTDPVRLARWWNELPLANIIAPTGVVFDVIDLDGPHAAALLREHVPDLPDGPLVRSGSGWRHHYLAPTGHGRHVGLLKAGPECGCPDDQGQPKRCGVDFLGTDGYVLLPPSRTSDVYRWLRPLDGVLPSAPDSLLQLLKERERAATAHEGAPVGEVDRTRPGGDYIARTSWAEVLEPHGWQVDHVAGEVTHWRRPGKQQGSSATTGYVGDDCLYCFSSNADPFQAGKSYHRFAAYTFLEHGGDFSAAAAELASRGYGQPDPDVEGFEFGPTEHQDEGQDQDQEPSAHTEGRCPKGVILVRKSGKVQPLRFDCDKWACPTCGPQRALKYAAHAVEVAGGGPLYAAELEEAEWRAAKRMTHRRNMGRMLVRRPEGGALFVTGQHLAAGDRSWSLTEVVLQELVAAMLTQRISRLDWSSDWRPETPLPKVVTDPVVDRITCHPKRMASILQQAGVVAGGYAKMPPEAAAARIRRAAHGGRRPGEHFC
jgi:hypothetical protein